MSTHPKIINLQPTHTALTDDLAPPQSAIGPDFPDEWYGWPLGIELAFQLWAGTGVCRELYEDYSADTIEEGAAKLFRERLYDVWPIYRLRTSWPIAPIYRVNLTRPLWRRTSEESLDIRGRIDGPSGDPDDEIADDTLMKVWFEGGTSAWSQEWWAYWPPSRRRAMLQVAGRNAEDADQRWHQCAKTMRRVYREATGWGRKGE